MKLLSKNKTTSESTTRRRPVQLREQRPQAFSYRAVRSMNETNTGRSQESLERQHTRSWRRFLGNRVPVVFLTVVLAVLIISQFLLNSSPRVLVLSSGDSSIFLQSTSIYQQAADKLFAAHFSNRNKLTVNVDAISSEMKKQFPELADVSVTLPFIGGQPTMYIEPSEPSFVLHTTSEGIFVLDSAGRAIVATSSKEVSTLNIPQVTDESGLRVSIGSTALPTTDVSFIQTVDAQITAQHISIRQIILPPVASEVDVYITGKPYFVKFNMQDESGALQQAGTFIATADQLAKQGITPAQYIDVRIDGRAYYK